jgi:hypothetical protein
MFRAPHRCGAALSLSPRHLAEIGTDWEGESQDHRGQTFERFARPA